MSDLSLAVKWSDNTADLARNLTTGLRAVDATKASVDKLVDSLSGSKQLQAADRWSQALQKLGGDAGPLAGIAKLTNDEIERGSGVIDRAIAKYQTLGTTAPKSLTDIATAIDKIQADRIAAAGDAANTAGGKFSALGKLVEDLKPKTDTAAGAFTSLKGSLSEAFENPTSSIQKFAGAVGTDLTAAAGTAGIAAAGIAGGLAVAGLAAFGFAEKAAGIGGQLNDLNEKTGVSVETLSRWRNAATVAGTSVDALANATFMMQKNLEENPTKFAEGLERLNLDYAGFKELAPEQQLETLATALKNTADPATRTAAGYETMGRQFRDLAPALYKLNDALEATKDLNPWTEKEAAQAEQFEMHVASIRTHIDAIGESLGRSVLPSVEHFVGALDTLAQWTPGQHMANLLKVMGGLASGGVTGAIGAVVGAGVDNLPPAFVGPQETPKAPTPGLVEGSSFQHTQELVAGFLKEQQAAQDKYVRAWQQTEDSIQAIWSEAFVARANLEDGSLKSQLAVLAARRQNDENAAATKIAETTGSEDQLNAMLSAIDAKYDALSYNALLASNRKELEAVQKLESDKVAASLDGAQKMGLVPQRVFDAWSKSLDKQQQDTQKSIDATSELWREYGELQVSRTGSTVDGQIAQVQRWFDNEVAKLKDDDENWQAHYDALAAVAQAKTQAIIEKNDPLLKAWKGLNVDLRQDWANTWDAALEKNGSFVDALISPWKAMESAWTKVLAAMVADWEAQFVQKLGFSIPGITGTPGSGSSGAGGGVNLGNLNLGSLFSRGGSSDFGGASGAGPGDYYGPTEGDGYYGPTTGGDSTGSSSGSSSGGGRGGQLAAAGIGIGAGVLAGLTANYTTKGGQVAHFAAEGAQYGALAGPIGAAAGAGIGALVGALKVNPEELAARDSLNAWVKQFTTDAEKAAGKTATLDDAITAVGKQYALMGKSGTLAQHDLQAAFDASHQSADAEGAALDTINKVLTDAAAFTNNVKTGVDAVTAAGQAFGGIVPDQFKSAVEQLANMQGITSDEKDTLLGLTADVKPNFDQLTQTASTYGITLAGLGPKFQEANIEGRAKGIFDDFESLTKAGGDAGGILLGMSGKISTLVTDSENFGVAIPDNMKPLIENLATSGKLLDDSGKKITDIGKITWEGTPVDSSVDKFQQALDRLTETLNHLPAAAANAANGMASALNGAGAPAPATAPGAATGGLVTSYGVRHFTVGGFVPDGTDTVPAMLTPGEIILNAAQQRNVGAMLQIGLSGELGGGRDDGLREEVAGLRSEMKSLARYLRKDQHTAIARAVRDEVGKVRTVGR
jgi:hypothetical protein